MASIGPQLPPHLSKRKRTPEDESEADSPPSKVTRHGNNEDEIDLGSDSDDSYGPPRAPAPDAAVFKTAVQPRIGPALNPKINNEAEIPLDLDSDSNSSSDDDDTGPAPAPSRSTGPTKPQNPTSQPSNSASSSSSRGPPAPPPPKAKPIGPSGPPAETTKRIIGPAPPPADLSSRPTADSDSDSDSDYGPALPTAAEAARAAEDQSDHNSNKGPREPEAPQRRDDWMLAPPTGGDFTGRVPDPTQLKKPRKFGSGKGGASTSGGGGGVSSIWTETADEKRKRLADAVLGRGADPVDEASSRSGGGASGRERAAAERDAQIQANMEAVRGESLYAQHQTALKEGRGGARSAARAADDDDPSKRAFDKQKDMALGGRITGSQRKELLNKAANFGGRFQKGSYL